MATILSLLNRFKNIDTDKVAEETMQEAEPLITDRQKGQLLEGLNAKGQKIGRYRSAAYARKKNAMNPIPGLGVPDLLLTGAFYRGVFTEVRGDKVIIDSTDEKADALAKKYGESIFGLNKPTRTEFVNDDLRPLFMKRIRKETGL